MKQNKNYFIETIIQVIKDNEKLRDSIIIKGGISVSIFLDLKNRQTKDFDTYILSDNEREIVKIFSESLEKIGYKTILKGPEFPRDANEESRYSKEPKLIVHSKDDKFEITFKTLKYHEGIIQKDGLKIVDPKLIVLDKIDRFSRLWNDQVEKGTGGPYVNFEKNIINGNFQRDLIDIYFLRDEISEISREEIEIMFNRWKEINSHTEKNYKHTSSKEMFEKFSRALFFLKNKKFIFEKIPTKFENVLKNEKILLKQNFKIDNYDEFIDYLISFANNFK